MQHRTPWSKQHQPGSLPSDRIRSHHQQKQQKQHKSSTQSAVPHTEQKSKAVRLLENLISNLNSSSDNPPRDPKHACFCLASEHPLSTYTPICTSCGLILCQLNKPHLACPHCSSPLLTTNQRTSLLDRLQTELSQTLANEQAKHERQIEQAKKEAGAFPALPPSSSTPVTTTTTQTPLAMPRATQPSADATHKVLSLNAKTKRLVVVSSSTASSRTSTPVPSRPGSRSSQQQQHQQQSEAEDDLDYLLVRVPPPSQTVDHASRRVDPSRPWQNLICGFDVKYISPPVRP